MEVASLRCLVLGVWLEVEDEGRTAWLGLLLAAARELTSSRTGHEPWLDKCDDAIKILITHN